MPKHERRERAVRAERQRELDFRLDPAMYDIVYEKTGREYMAVSELKDRQRRNSIIDIYDQTRKGDVLRNEQIEAVLDKTADVLERERQGEEGVHLDRRGKKLSEDLEGIVLAMRQMVRDKNQNERFQYMMREGWGSLRTNAQRLRGQKPRDMSQVSAEAQPLVKESREFMTNIRRLGFTLFRSSEFKDIASDALELFKLMLSQTQERVKTGGKKKVAPAARQQPQYIPRPVSRGHIEAEDKEMEVISEEEELALRSPRQYREERFVPQMEPPRVMPDIRTEYGRSQEYIPRSSVESQTYSTTSQAAVGGGGSELTDQMRDRFVSILRRVGEKPEYKRAMDSFFHIMDHISQRAGEARKGVSTEQEQSKKAMYDARKLTEAFVGRENWAHFRKSYNKLWKDFQGDQEVKDFWKDLRRFMRDAVQQPERLEDRYQQDYARDLIVRGRRIMQSEKYRARTRKVYDRSKVMFTAVSQDTALQSLSTKFQQLLKDFYFNAEGKPDIWAAQDSMHQMKLIMLPLLRRHLAYVPLDRIDISNPRIDAKIEDLVITADDILPELVHFDFRNTSDVFMRDLEMERNLMTVRMHLKHIRPHFHGVHFAYRSYKFPKMSDYGVVDFDLLGHGMSITIDWVLINETNLPLRARLNKVKCSIHRLGIHFHGSLTKHNILDKMAVALFKGTIKKRIAAAVATNVGKSITRLNQTLNTYFESKPVGKLKDMADRSLKAGHQRTLVAREKLRQKRQQAQLKKKDKEKAKRPSQIYREERPVVYAESRPEDKSRVYDYERRPATPTPYRERPVQQYEERLPTRYDERAKYAERLPAKYEERPQYEEKPRYQEKARYEERLPAKYEERSKYEERLPTKETPRLYQKERGSKYVEEEIIGKAETGLYEEKRPISQKRVEEKVFVHEKAPPSPEEELRKPTKGRAEPSTTWEQSKTGKYLEQEILEGEAAISSPRPQSPRMQPAV